MTMLKISFLPLVLLATLRPLQDTVAAWTQHPPFRRIFPSQRCFTKTTTLSMTAATSSSSSSTIRPRKLVVVGGGIGGLSSAFDARHLLRPQDEITVVSDRPSFQFTPSNPWVGVRKRTPEDISLPLDRILPKHNIAFVHQLVTKLDPRKQQLTLRDGTRMEYDFLIVATGPRLAFEEVPGTGPKGYSASICTTPHASEAAEALDRLTKDPGPVVVGAVQGASCFGPAYEMALLLINELGKRGGKALVDKCKMTFVTSEPYVGHLGLMGAGESRQILEKLLTSHNVDWITNCSVKKVSKESVSVEYLEESKDGKHVKKNKTLPSKYTMLIPAFRGMGIWTSVPGLTDKAGMILVDEHQQSIKYPNIFGVGICVHLDNLEETPVPTGVPKTGYMIESMGTAAVKNIRAMIDFEETHKESAKDEKQIELHYKPLLNGLCITDFGDDGAIFLTLPQIPPRRADYTIEGKVATLAKLAFEKYFLYKVETGDTDPYYEKYMLRLIGVDRTVED